MIVATGRPRKLRDYYLLAILLIIAPFYVLQARFSVVRILSPSADSISFSHGPTPKISEVDFAATDSTRTGNLTGSSYSSNNQTDKLQLVFHVGPRKTATTSIQTFLTQFQEEGHLATDNWEYAGRICHPFRGKTRMVSGCSLTDLLRYGRTVLLHECLVTAVDGNRSSCVKKQFQTELEAYRKRKKNVIMSDESWGKAKFRSPAHYLALREALSEDWEITIVTGYRYFFDWLPSDLFQNYRLDHAQQVWHEKWSQEGGRAIELVFPKFYNTWHESGKHVYTDWVVHCVNNTFPLKIIDLHQTGSVRTQFFCDVLHCPHSCQISQALDAAESQEARVNSHTNVMPVDYDIVAFQAEEMVNKSAFSRVRLRQALLEYDTNQRLTNDFRRCPSPTQLEDHLEQALNMDVAVWGKRKAATRESSLREAFRQRINEDFFCSVNASAVLQSDFWKDFLTTEQNHLIQ